MGETIKSIFGFGRKEPTGPDPALQRAQQKQLATAKRQEETANRSLAASLRAGANPARGRRRLLAVGRENELSRRLG